jgi:DNA end-binding protein Ku
MQQLYYPNEVRSIDELDLGETDVRENELRMAIQLAEMSASDEFRPEQYRDEVQERVRGLIQKKIEGEEITASATEEPRAEVIDLMDALRKSLGGIAPAPAIKPAATAKKAAPAEKLPIKAKADRKAPKRAPRTAARAAAAKTASRARR